MAAGDAQRTWFPEMLEVLRTRWHAGLSFADLIELCQELGTILHRIRSERHIRAPVIRCPQCGHVREAAEPHVTVRAMILSLGRLGIAPTEDVKELDKRWAAYRKQNGLDSYGGPADRRSQRERVGCRALIQTYPADPLGDRPRTCLLYTSRCV